MKILAIIPARCGSKGFPNKNIARIENKTLIELAVNIGIQSELVDDIYISTDCKEYEQIAIDAGASSLGLRPKELATDFAKSIDVIIDLIQKINKKYTHIVLLQPTSPLREPNDIKQMIRLMEEKSADASVSVVQLEEPHPYKLKSISDDGYIKPFIDGTTSEVARQLLPKAYALNGAIYIANIEIILKDKTFLPTKTVPYLMQNNINIDTIEDFLFLESMYKNEKIKIFGVDNG